MADINKITKTKLKATEKNTSPTVDLEPGEIKAITKSRLIGNVSGGGSGGESVSPTLNLIDLKEGTPRTTITEEEKINLEKGLYNQFNYIQDRKEISLYKAMMPTKIFNYAGNYIFSSIDGLEQKGENNFICSSMCMYVLAIGTKNTSGEYPITIEKQLSINLGSGGGSSSTPLELTGTFDISNPSQQFKDITLTDEQVATIKSKYENKEPLIIRVKYFPIENMGYAFDLQNMGVFSKTENGVNDYALTTLVSLNLGTTLNLLITIDTSTKTLSCREQKLLNEKETSLGIIEQNSELRINSSYGDTPAYIGESIYIDTINGKKILHTDNVINNYDLGKSINLFGTHSILVPSTSTDTAINLYNHFIKITGTVTSADGDKNIVARFIIHSSNNLEANSPDNLYTLLGNEFELGCNGFYGNYNITGLKKIADGSLNIIYNNNGAESLLSTTGITLTISDNVKTI